MDKYRHLRPRRSRSCYRGDGIPKVRYTKAEAQAKASEFEGYHHYRCPECGTWHVGRESAA